MSLLSKLIAENPVISRGEAIEGIAEIVAIASMASGCAPFLYPTKRTEETSEETSSLVFDSTYFIEKNPWVKDEIRSFLGQEEVKEALGFVPLDYKPITLIVMEGSILMGYGLEHRNGSAWINGYLFSETDPEQELVEEGFTKEEYQIYLDKLMELRSDTEMLRLYRELLVAHEVAHIGEWYSFLSKNPVTLTSHEVMDRIEIKILTNLYNAGKVNKEMYQKIIDFFEKYFRIETNNFNN